MEEESPMNVKDNSQQLEPKEITIQPEESPVEQPSELLPTRATEAMDSLWLCLCGALVMFLD